MARTTVLALGIAALATPAAAQTVPNDQDMPAAGLDLPANLQIFGKADPNIRKPTAIVNDTVITGTDVDQRVALAIAFNGYQQLPAADMDRLRLQILRGLIDETLQIQAATAEKITVSRDEIDRAFAGISRNYRKSPEEMRAWIKQIGSSERSIRRQIEGELAWSRLIRRRIDISVGQAEIDAILERLRAARGTPEYHLFEIFQYATPDRANEVVAAQQRMIEQLRQGTPFEYLARANSEASTRSVGGDLGWIRLPMLQSAPLEGAVAQMRVGQIAGPIELPAGFSIIYLADQRAVLTADARDAKLSLKQMTITFPTGTTEAQATNLAASFAKATSEMQGCGDVARAAAATGAAVVDNDTMKIKDLPAPLQTMMLNLQIGQATQPFGSVEEGVRVLVLCGRDEPTDASEPSREAIEDQITETRTNLRAQRMLRDLRRDALVEYR
ncbi:MAG: peptidylprolyl isomerase [Pseudomonadota bacterium]